MILICVACLFMQEKKKKVDNNFTGSRIKGQKLNEDLTLFYLDLG